MRGWLVVLAVAVASVVGCGGESTGGDGGCVLGSEGCACNLGKCLTGLECLSGLCVDPGNGTGGTGGSAGSGGTAGTGGVNRDLLRILVTNARGVGGLGLDVVVEALRGDPNNDIIVCAPAQNQGGAGDTTTPTPPPLEATTATTASGYPATAVDGSPADSVLYALDNLYPDEPPHVVLSGIDAGQSVGNIEIGPLGLLSQVSGTVGAAKTAACASVPALASSQGEGDTLDYESGVTEVQMWLEENRAALLAGEVPVENIVSINIPSCDVGMIRGRLEVPLATENPNGYILTAPADCTSTVDDVPNDVEAFFNGYTTITPVPRATTCPGK